jgi:transcriptional regulator with XRE-family HTH domain
VDLATLINTTRSARGQSLQDLADLSDMHKQTWHVHANPKPRDARRIPDRATILKLAKGLRVDPRAIMLAIGETLEVIPPDEATPALILSLPPWEVLDRLSPRDIGAVLNLIWVLVDRDGDREHAGAGAPGGGARSRVSAAATTRRGSVRGSVAGGIPVPAARP